MRLLLAILLLRVCQYTSSFSFRTGVTRPLVSFLYSYSDDDDNPPPIDDDWRLFRAKLVNSTSPSFLPPTSSSLFAYDAQSAIETGSIIVGAYNPDLPAQFALNQQYFHKSVILILDHDRQRFTRGIILNRNVKRKMTIFNKSWEVYFGGDVGGFAVKKSLPEIVCIHSLKNNDQVDRVSMKVNNDISWTTIDAASILIDEKHATIDNFHTFCGYAGWAKDQLQGELERDCWFSIAADSNFLVDELKETNSDERNSGIQMWSRLMNLLGKPDIVEASTNSFSDLMLKMWTQRMLFDRDNNSYENAPSDAPTTSTILKSSPINRLIAASNQRSHDDYKGSGSIVVSTSPNFLLNQQQLHKAVVLVLEDSAAVTVGVIINRVSSSHIDVELNKIKTKKPIFFGGEYQMKGREKLLWIFQKKSIYKTGEIGMPVEPLRNEFFYVNTSGALDAIERGIGTIDDFVVVNGVSVWTKGEGGEARGMAGEISSGHFAAPNKAFSKSSWEVLTKMEPLCDANVGSVVLRANEVWAKNCDKNLAPVSEDAFVYDSDKTVNQLGDDALIEWIKVFMLQVY